MLVEEIFLFMLLGAMSSAIMGFFISEGKSIKLLFVLGFQGIITGLISGYFWVTLTGGLDVGLVALTLPVIISSGISYIILYYIPRSYGDVDVPESTTMVAGAFLVAIVFFVAFSSVPIAYSSSLNTQTFSVEPLDWDAGAKVVDVDVITPTNAIPIEIEHKKSSTGIDALAEKPSEGRYMDFKITFDPKIKWNKPYLKMAIYKDTDNDGKLSDGDIMWSDTNYKTTSYSYWRTNCLWENGQPTYEILSTSEGKLLPIFHADQVTGTLDETGKTLKNTPQMYEPTADMLSWDSNGLQDQVVKYASVDNDETTSIQGKIYCNRGTAGKHFILVRAYDATTSNPFSDDYPPIKEEIIPFEVTTTPQTVTIVGIPLNLGLVIAVAFLGAIVILVYIKKEEGY